MSSATGFHSLALDAERAASLSVTGTLPEWLSGVLIRNGPGAFEFGDAGVSRLFVLDGETLTERARVRLPLAFPFDFHGRFFAELSP